MPTTVNELLKAFKLPQTKGVQWGEPIPCQDEGVYIVSLSSNPNANDGTMKKASISKSTIQKWLQKVDGFELDKRHTEDPDEVIERLSQFWLPDENIIYIGKAPKRENNKGIGNRVNEFYKTEYGEKRPHSGGHWLKSLSILESTYVYYAPCSNPADFEWKLLDYFSKNVSNETKQQLMDPNLPLPFGNLELRKGQKKQHGLRKMKVK